MGIIKSFISRIEQSINDKPDFLALVDYPGKSHTYGQMAYAIEGIIQELESHRFPKGEKIAICARNGISWIEVYLAIVIGGYVAVVLPDNLSLEDILLLMKRADCNTIFAERRLMKLLCGKVDRVFDISLEPQPGTRIDNAIVSSDKEFHISFPDRDLDSVCTILFTSGSMGKPRGVMLSVRNISCDMNCYFVNSYTCAEEYHINVLLPFYHIYGLIDDAIMPLCFGKTSVIFSLPCSPQNICALLKEYRPQYFFTVPKIVKLIIDYLVGEDLYSEKGQHCIHNKEISRQYCQELKSKIVSSLGGNFKAFLVGGSSMNPDFERVMTESIGIPILTGYGLTECGNLTNNTTLIKIYSSGTPFSYVQMRINSKSPYSIPGEIQVKGDNVFVGYYNDPESTKTAFTEDGWFRTGDLGYFDSDNYLYITGRCKDMLLTSNGENIYPEEAEEAMNSSTYIRESVLAQRGEKLHAIVVPDRELARADGLDEEALTKKIDDAVREAGKKLPGFTIINSFELRDQPLERTPKGSLKRYLYSDGIKEI